MLCSAPVFLLLQPYSCAARPRLPPDTSPWDSAPPQPRHHNSRLRWIAQAPDFRSPRLQFGDNPPLLLCHPERARTQLREGARTRDLCIFLRRHHVKALQTRHPLANYKLQITQLIKVGPALARSSAARLSFVSGHAFRRAVQRPLFLAWASASEGHRCSRFGRAGCPIFTRPLQPSTP